ncbi:MAG: hypothetical protein WD875_05310 [Pirellulales bacterium]
MKLVPFRIVAINVFAAALLMLVASFAFEDPIRLVLRCAALADTLLGIFFWSKANRQQQSAAGD